MSGHEATPLRLRTKNGQQPEAARRHTFHTISHNRRILPGRIPLLGIAKKAFVSLDIGSGNIKAAWKLKYDDVQEYALQNGSLRNGCTPATWDNHLAYIPSQMAFRFYENQIDGMTHIEPIFGKEVDDAIEIGDIGEDERLTWIKPAIFDHSQHDARRLLDNHLHQRLKKLKMRCEDEGVPENEWSDIDPAKLFF